MPKRNKGDILTVKMYFLGLESLFEEVYNRLGKTDLVLAFSASE